MPRKHLTTLHLQSSSVLSCPVLSSPLSVPLLTACPPRAFISLRSSLPLLTHLLTVLFVDRHTAPPFRLLSLLSSGLTSPAALLCSAALSVSPIAAFAVAAEAAFRSFLPFVAVVSALPRRCLNMLELRSARLASPPPLPASDQMLPLQS